MSASHDKKVAITGHPDQIDPTKGKIQMDGKEMPIVTADDLPPETPLQEFKRLYRGAFMKPNAMKKHAGRKPKKAKGGRK